MSENKHCHFLCSNCNSGKTQHSLISTLYLLSWHLHEAQTHTNTKTHTHTALLRHVSHLVFARKHLQAWSMPSRWHPGLPGMTLLFALSSKETDVNGNANHQHLSCEFTCAFFRCQVTGDELMRWRQLCAFLRSYAFVRWQHMFECKHRHNIQYDDRYFISDSVNSKTQHMVTWFRHDLLASPFYGPLQLLFDFLCP